MPRLIKSQWIEQVRINQEQQKETSDIIKKALEIEKKRNELNDQIRSVCGGMYLTIDEEIESMLKEVIRSYLNAL